MKVITVLGEIAPEEMGVTQLHEHILANADYSGNDFNITTSATITCCVTLCPCLRPPG